MFALSVSTSAMISPIATGSPGRLSHLRILPSSMVSESFGMVTSIGMRTLREPRGRRPCNHRDGAAERGCGSRERALVSREKGFEQTGPVERFASRWLDAYIGMTDEIVAHCRGRVRARRLVTVYDGVDCAEFAPGGGGAVRREFGIPADALVAGIVGHLQEWKGQHLVV